MVAAEDAAGRPGAFIERVGIRAPTWIAPAPRGTVDERFAVLVEARRATNSYFMPAG